MDTTEKNGQPSMEEILASIRRIIAEEPVSTPHAIDLKPAAASDSAIDEHSDFELPSIFRSPPAPAEKSTPLFGRLTDAIRGATATAASEARPARDADDSGSDLDGQTPRSARKDAPSLPFGTLSSLKSAARNESQGSEERSAASPSPDEAASQGASGKSSALPSPAPAPASSWRFGRSGTPAPPAIQEEIKRVMAPFKDTHFLQLSNPKPLPEATSTGPLPSAPFPAPAEPPPPARRVDFGSIIPAHLDLPGVPASHRHADSGAPPEPAATPHAWPDRGPPPPPEVSPFAPSTLSPAYGRPDAGEDYYAAHRPAAPLSSQETGQTGTIEDTTAELLRPMLRQWLADNMPRMVEKALHIEVAESVRTGRKFPSQ
jgi:hypothetical protein